MCNDFECVDESEKIEKKPINKKTRARLMVKVYHQRYLKTWIYDQ